MSAKLAICHLVSFPTPQKDDLATAQLECSRQFAHLRQAGLAGIREAEAHANGRPGSPLLAREGARALSLRSRAWVVDCKPPSAPEAAACQEHTAVLDVNITRSAWFGLRTRDSRTLLRTPTAMPSPATISRNDFQAAGQSWVRSASSSRKQPWSQMRQAPRPGQRAAPPPPGLTSDDLRAWQRAPTVAHGAPGRAGSRSGGPRFSAWKSHLACDVR
mgnify:CR=1 FL=1